MTMTSEIVFGDKTVTAPAALFVTAFHEAGHIAVAYGFGWHLDPVKGARIGNDPRCSFVHPPEVHTEAADVIVTLAGNLADGRAVPDCAASVDDRELLEVLEQLRAGEVDDGDTYLALSRVVRSAAGLTYEAIMARYREYERQTAKLLDRPDVWAPIEVLATHLLRNRTISDMEARRCIAFAVSKVGSQICAHSGTENNKYQRGK